MKRYQLVAVSNTNELFASLKIEENQYAKFDFAILSYKIKSLRPELKAYRTILRKTHARGEECLYIDSKKEMLVPAKNLGMQTIFFKNNSQLFKDLKKYKILT
jgi:FMN phosphatase YigB (HAD superfamily)